MGLQRASCLRGLLESSGRLCRYSSRRGSVGFRIHTTLGEAGCRRVFWSWGLGKLLKITRRKRYIHMGQDKDVWLLRHLGSFTSAALYCLNRGISVCLQWASLMLWIRLLGSHGNMTSSPISSQSSFYCMFLFFTTVSLKNWTVVEIIHRLLLVLHSLGQRLEFITLKDCSLHCSDLD
jgi:hypothetical protein